MKKKLVAGVLATTMSLCFSNAFAQMSSAKGSAAISGLTVLDTKTNLIDPTIETHSFDPILSTYIKIAQDKELVFDVSLECGLYTDTLVKSKGGDKDTSTATAGVDVHVKLEKIMGTDAEGNTIFGDPIYAYPGEAHSGVTFCKREQELMAKFQGIFQECVSTATVTDPYTGETVEECIDYGPDTCLIVTGEDTNGDGIDDSWTTTVDEDCLDYEEVQLILETVNANAFNFVSPNLDQGEYKVTVEAEISSNIDFSNGGAEAKAMIGWGSMVVDEAKAMIGWGSMVVDEVRFIKGDDGTN